MLKTALPKRNEISKNLLYLYTESSLNQGIPEFLYNIDNSNFMKYASFEIKLSLYNKAA